MMHMLELAADLLPRLRAGDRIAVVTVTRVSRSAPRGAGASMAVTGGGEVIGSISGGCVESDAVLLAVQALATGRGATARFGFTDAEAHAAGLACGGAIDVIAYPLASSDAFAVDALEAVLRDEPVAVGLVISEESTGSAGESGSLGTYRARHGRRPAKQHPDPVSPAAPPPGHPRRRRLRRGTMPRCGGRRLRRHGVRCVGPAGDAGAVPGCR